MNEEKEIKKALEKVMGFDNKNIIELGLIKKIRFDPKIMIDIIFPYPSMHLKNRIIKEITHSIKDRLNTKKEIGVNIQIQQPPIDNYYKRNTSLIKNIIAIASGKGGVGKSTIASNLSICLLKMGYHVGLLDADIHGPSIPIMFNINPKNISISHQNRLINPIDKYGIKVLSIGFFSREQQAIVWRGPMVTKALVQFIHETNWGKLDFLVIDLPPGTGDIHLSLLQESILKGVVIVATSQKVAIYDVIRTIEMFRIKSISVPILGIIENMSFFSPNNSSQENQTRKYFLFGKNEVKKISEKMNLCYLGGIPFLQKIQEYSDLGIPVVLNCPKIKKIFMKITKNILKNIKN